MFNFLNDERKREQENEEMKVTIFQQYLNFKESIMIMKPASTHVLKGLMTSDILFISLSNSIKSENRFHQNVHEKSFIVCSQNCLNFIFCYYKRFQHHKSEFYLFATSCFNNFDSFLFSLLTLKWMTTSLIFLTASFNTNGKR